MAPEPITPDAAETALFGEALALDVVLRCALHHGPLPAGAHEAAERLLRDVAMIEERRADEAEATGANDPALRRLEAKLDLTLQLLAGALPQLAGPAPRTVRIGARGLRLAANPALPAAAVLRWQPAEGLPLCLELAMTRVAQAEGRDWWAFEALPAALEDALSRHLFRLHRREVATQRRT